MDAAKVGQQQQQSLAAGMVVGAPAVAASCAGAVRPAQQEGKMHMMSGLQEEDIQSHRCSVTQWQTADQHKHNVPPTKGGQHGTGGHKACYVAHANLTLGLTET